MGNSTYHHVTKLFYVPPPSVPVASLPPSLGAHSTPVHRMGRFRDALEMLKYEYGVMREGLHPHHELLQVLHLFDQLIWALVLLNIPLEFL